MIYKFSIFIVLLCVVLSFSTTNGRAITYDTQWKIGQQCINETGINPDIIHKALKTDMNPPDIYKVYLTCNYKLHGFFDANGQVAPDVIANFLADHYDKDEAKYILNECTTIQKSTLKDTVFETAKCFLAKDKEIRQTRKKNAEYEALIQNLKNSNLV